MLSDSICWIFCCLRFAFRGENEMSKNFREMSKSEARMSKNFHGMSKKEAEMSKTAVTTEK